MKPCINEQCNRQIPEAARHCPYCGQDQASKRRYAQLFFLTGVSMLSVMVILAAQALSPDNMSANIPASTHTTKTVNIDSPRPSATQATILASRTSIPATNTAMQLTPTRRTSTPTEISTSTTCPGAPPTRIRINDLVQVITTNQDRLVLRSDPEINARTELRRLDTGTRLKIFDGPVCVQDPETSIHYWFWEVRVKSTDTRGWVAEGDRSLYFLEFVR